MGSSTAHRGGPRQTARSRCGPNRGGTVHRRALGIVGAISWVGSWAVGGCAEPAGPEEGAVPGWRAGEPLAGPGLEIELEGADVALAWAPWPGATEYTVWHATAPYFEPGDPGATALGSGPDLGFAHAVAGDGQPHYYRVVAHADDGDAVSPAVGKHAHVLYPGYNKVPQPLETDVGDAASFLEAHAPHGVGAFLWQAPAQAFAWWLPGGGSSSFEYGPGQVPIVLVEGAWAKVYEDVGRVPAPGAVRLALSPGQNLVTVPLDFGDTTASALLAAVPGAWRVGRWDPIAQDRVWFEGGAGDFAIAAGRDAYVETSQASWWPPEPGSTAPPPHASPLEGIGALEPVVTGRLFTEGALWRPGEGALYFTDLEADEVWRYAPDTGASLVREASGRFTNGMAVDSQGRRIECQQRAQAVVAIEADGSETVLASAWQGVTLNSPNDAVVGPDGSLYFGDATIGAMARFGDVHDMPLGFRGVFRLDPAGALHLVADDLVDPTGIELSPDATTLYVSDWSTGWVRAYPVADDGSTGPGQVINVEMAMADGMCSDVDGNLYVATVQGLWVLRPDGTPWGLLPVPEEPSNCTFGGEGLGTLYVTAQTSVYAVPAVIPGAPSWGG